MRLHAIAALAALVGCYTAPAGNPACTVACSDSCPSGLACVNGFCVEPGERCEPHLTRVFAGNGFACALDRQQRRWCWGANDQHQLDASTRQVLVYATLIDDGPWDALATGGDHTCGLRVGKLLCWGGNDRQQISGTVSGDVGKPHEIKAPNKQDWTFVATGAATTCGIAGGRLYCWGQNNYGQAGLSENPADIGSPSAVTDIADWTTVGVGRDHACAVSTSAGLYCWGRNHIGQLGDGATVFDSKPKPPSRVALSGVSAVAASHDTTCAIADGQLYCWGNAAGYGLGDPAVAIVDACVGRTSTPILASMLAGWTHLSASTNHACAVRDGELWCWGTTTSGLGNGVWGSSGFLKVADGVTDVSVGWSSNFDDLGVEISDLDLICFVVAGEIKCWGDNRFGQLAQGGATMAPVPTEITGGHTWTALESGDSHVCGIETGVAYCWGTNRLGHLDGQPTGDSPAAPCGEGRLCATGEPRVVPYLAHADAIELGDEHTCALDGQTLTCWGPNSHGQLGMLGVAGPYVVPGAWTQLYGNASKGQCAAQNGQTYCWGSITSVRQPITRDMRMDGMKSIGITSFVGSGTTPGGATSHGCVLDSLKRLACFGVDLNGQFGRGAPTALCGNATCELTETETSCAIDCMGKRTCTQTSCGVTECRAVCGDGHCNMGYAENCSVCPQDCGACPYTTTTRTYEALAVSTSSGTGFTCGVRLDRKVECWGRNNKGQAGALNPMTNQVIDPVFTPNVIAGLESCTAVSGGASTACAICGGDIYCWGNHRFGHVGAGPITAFPITVPRKLEVDIGDDTWAQLTSGEGFTCARTGGGRGFCWGFHALGALGTGAVSSNVPVPIKTAP